MKQLVRILILAGCAWTVPVQASDGRLQWTGGVGEVDGAAGGGLVPWALVAGLGTEDEVGASAFASTLATQRFQLRAAGAALGIRDRVELSYARVRFDIGDLVPGVDLGTDEVGIKLRVAGDAIYDQDRPWPQVAVGAIRRRTEGYPGVPRLLGAARGVSTDWYVAATKVYLDGPLGRRVLANLTVRRSDANQIGLLGSGGTRGAEWRAEGTLGVWLADQWLLGVDYRDKRGALATPPEHAARDVFLAFGATKHVTLVAAIVDLGVVAGEPPQHGLYGSVSLGW